MVVLKIVILLLISFCTTILCASGISEAECNSTFANSFYDNGWCYRYGNNVSCYTNGFRRGVIRSADVADKLVKLYVSNHNDSGPYTYTFSIAMPNNYTYIYGALNNSNTTDGQRYISIDFGYSKCVALRWFTSAGLNKYTLTDNILCSIPNQCLCELVNYTTTAAPTTTTAAPITTTALTTSTMTASTTTLLTTTMTTSTTTLLTTTTTTEGATTTTLPDTTSTMTTIAETTFTTPPGFHGYYCPPGSGYWNLINRWCFQAGDSATFGYGRSFSDAENNCQQRSPLAHLAYIYNQEMWGSFTYFRNKKTYYKDVAVWLGYSENNNVLMWTTGSTSSYIAVGSSVGCSDGYFGRRRRGGGGGGGGGSHCGGGGHNCGGGNLPVYSDKDSCNNDWNYATNGLLSLNYICMTDAVPYIIPTELMFTASPTNAAVNQDITFSLAPFWGEHNTTRYTWNFGDNSAVATTNSRTYTKSYPQSGWYNVSVTVTNIVSTNYTLWALVNVLQDCRISSVDYPVFATNFTSSVTIQLNYGTNCTLTINYNDGSSIETLGYVEGDITSCTTAKAPCGANNKWITTAPHNYINPNVYSIIVTAKNVITNQVNTYSLKVQTILSGLQIVSPNTYVYIPYGDNLLVVLQAYSGSNWNFITWIGVSNITTTWFPSTLNGSITVQPKHLTCIGHQILYIQAYNDISSQYLNYTFQVEYLFLGFSYLPVPTYLQTNFTYDLTFSFDNASHFNYSIDFGNGMQKSYIETSTIIADKNTTLLYNPFTYSDPNIYLLTITVTNHVNTKRYLINVTVQNPVSWLTYSTSSPGHLATTIGALAPVVFSLTFATGHPYPTDAFYDYDYGEPGGALSQEPFVLEPVQTKTYSYNHFAIYNTTVKVYNLISSWSFSLLVTVVVEFKHVVFDMKRYIPNIGTEPHNYYVKTNELLEFTTLMTDGSNYNLTWTFGDGLTLLDNSVMDTILQHNHSYNVAGFYNASILLQNAYEIYPAVLPIPFNPFFIVVQDVIVCFQISLIEGNEILIPFNNQSGGAGLQLVVTTDPACGRNVGTLPRYIIDWGDGNPWQNNSVNSTTYVTASNQYRIIIPHTYYLSDIYNLNVTIWNEVSHTSFQEVIQVFQQVHSTGITTRWINDQKKEIVGYFANETQGFFPLEYVVIFHAQKSFGTFEQYNWTFSDGWDAGSTNQTISRKFVNHGTYLVSVFINNNLANSSFTFTVFVERSITTNVTLWDNSPWPRNYTSWHEFRLNTDTVPTDACYFLNFNDTDTNADDPYRFYGNLSVCKKFYPDYYPPAEKAFVQEVNVSALESLINKSQDANITWNHKFWTLGKKPVEVRVINHVSSLYFIYYSYVTRGPCSFPIPVVKLKNTCTTVQKCRCGSSIRCNSQAEMLAGDRISYVKDSLLIDADTSVNCTSSPTVWFNWTLEAVDENGNGVDVTEYLNGTNYFGFNTKILTVPAKSIPLGRYRFTLMVSPSLEVDMEIYDSTIIYIKTSPLIASFSSLNALYVEQKDAVVFDAWSNSYDPDAVGDPKSNMSFTFYCRRACESWPEPNNMQIYTDWRKYNHTECDASKEGYSQKGCFVATDKSVYPGPRPLDYVGSPNGEWKQTTTLQGLPGGNVTLKTTKDSMAPGLWYSLMVVVNKQNDNTRMAFQELMFFISNTTVPRVEIKCVTNCQTDTVTMGTTGSLRQYRRVNPTSRLAIEAQIEGFAVTETYTYEWELIERPPEITNTQFDINNLPLVNDSEWLHKATTNRTLRTMCIDENLWNASSNGAGFYFALSLTIGKEITAASPRGVYYYEFFLNSPPNPNSGTCEPNMPVGYALDTSFGIICRGFRDSQSNDLYYYVKQKLDPKSMFWIDSGSSQTSQMLDKTIHISAIAGPEESSYYTDFTVRIIDSSGSSIMLQVPGRVFPFDLNNTYYYNPVYSIFNFTESCTGCDLEDYFLTKTKEQKTSDISAVARTFASMLNRYPSSGCMIHPCDNTTTNCTAEEILAPTTEAPDQIPPDVEALIQKHLGNTWLTLSPCQLDLKLRINLRERMTTTFSSLQIPYFSSFVQVVSALYPVTLIPEENTIQIMEGVQACLAKGVAAMDGVDPLMNMELEADIREEACTSVISIVSNMERTTNYYGSIWRDQLIKYYPNFNMKSLMAEIEANLTGSSTVNPTGQDLWEEAKDVYMDDATLVMLNEIRENITLIHVVLDKIYDLKDIITKYVQDRKVMGERPSILITENITAIYHKTPTKNLTGFPVIPERGCQFTTGDPKQMFGNLDSFSESVMAAGECGKNNPFTTDISAKNLTGYIATMSFKNSSGPIPVSGLITPIDVFVPRKIDLTMMQPIWNATRAFNLPLLIHRFQMPKFYGLSLLLYDGYVGTPKENITDATNSTDNSTELPTTAPITTTHLTTVEMSNATDAEIIKILPKFAVFIAYWTTFSVNRAKPYDSHCVLPLSDDVDNNETNSDPEKGNPRMCTVSYQAALKAKPSDFNGKDDFVSVYVAIRSIPDGKTFEDFQKTTTLSSSSGTFIPQNYTLFGVLADCHYYHTESKQWKMDGTEVGPKTTIDVTHCLTTHLTSFSSGFSLPINDLNLEDSGFAHLAENPIAFVFCLCIIALYLILLVWCRRKDKEDVMKAGIAPLPDNDPEDKYLYQIVFYTGAKQNAGTTAKIYFVITGEEEESDVRIADDLHRPAFRRNGIDTFIMAVPRPLGKMTHLRIWHDNAGKSPSWYFKRFQVLDVQTGEQFFFICDKWLAVEEGDGQIERVLPVAGKHDLTAFDQLFAAKTQKNLFDGHIWFSVFRRPPRSSFTRVQRLTCCLSLIYCTMVANIMFFGTKSQEAESNVILSVGPITVTLTTLVTGLIAGLVVVPVNTVLVLIFRYAKPSPPKTPLKEYEDKMKYHKKIVKKEEKKFKKEVKKEVKRCKKAGNVQQGGVHEDQNENEPTEPVDPTKREFVPTHHAPEQPSVVKIDTRARKKFQLPHWTIYVGYVLAFCTVAVGFWLIVQFAFGFGRAKALQWVIAMFVSLIQSIIFVQPLKILALAIVYSLLCKKPEKDDYEPSEIELREDEVYMHGAYSVNDLYDPEKRREMKMQLKKTRHVVPPEVQAVRDMRERKLKELAMWALIREILFYAVFLYTVMMVAYGGRDLLSYQIVKNNVDIFINGKHAIVNRNGSTKEKSTKFTDINNYDDFFKWTQQVFLPGLYPLGNGDYSMNVSDPGYAVDEQGFLAGTARFRQIRVKQDSCKVTVLMKNVINHCRSEYSFFSEDKEDYNSYWHPLNSSDSTDIPDKYFTWQSMTTLKMQLIMGHISTYWGGGYVAELGNSSIEAYSAVQELSDNTWLDSRTRAIFVEFSLYYPAINMFAISELAVEFMASGGAVVTPQFQVMRLNPYWGLNKYPIMIGEAMCCLFLLYFLYREVKKLKVEKKQYFLHFWNWMEISVIVLSITAIVMYAYRMIVRNDTITYYEANPYSFNNFAYPFFWEQLYGYMIYIVLFIANIKFLRILRFNKRISSIVDTMSYGWKYMLAFLGTVLFIVMAFASAAILFFGDHLKDFMTFINVILNLNCVMLNKFDWSQFQTSFFGPLFFVLFTIIVQFVLVNMFLSIVNDSFTVVKHDLSTKGNDYELMSFVWFKFKSLFCGMHSVDPNMGDLHEMYMEEPDEYDKNMDQVNEKMENMMFRLDDFVKQEKAETVMSGFSLDEDGCIKKRVFVSD